MDKQLDVKRMLDVKRGQIYLCKLDDVNSKSDDNKIYSKTGLIGKTRPCLIVSSDKYNDDPNRLTYRIVPIKTNHTDLPTEEFVKKSNDILIPIDMAEGTKFLVINQSRPINIGCISTYIGTITNKQVLNQVDLAIIGMDTEYEIAENDKELVSLVKDTFGSLYKFQHFLNDHRVKKVLHSYNNGIPYNTEPQRYIRPSIKNKHHKRNKRGGYTS